MTLSRREQEILAALEAQLDAPEATAAEHEAPRSTGRQFLLMLIPQGLMVLFGVVWNFGIAGLAVVIGAGVLIWLVVVSHTAAPHRDPSRPRVAPEP